MMNHLIKLRLTVQSGRTDNDRVELGVHASVGGGGESGCRRHRGRTSGSLSDTLLMRSGHLLLLLLNLSGDGGGLNLMRCLDLQVLLLSDEGGLGVGLSMSLLNLGRGGDLSSQRHHSGASRKLNPTTGTPAAVLAHRRWVGGLLGRRRRGKSRLMMKMRIHSLMLLLRRRGQLLHVLQMNGGGSVRIDRRRGGDRRCRQVLNRHDGRKLLGLLLRPAGGGDDDSIVAGGSRRCYNAAGSAAVRSVNEIRKRVRRLRQRDRRRW